SGFLAGFLTLLAAVGLLCLALVLASLFPGLGLTFLALTLLAPAAGWFYWQRAGRVEQVQVELRSGLADSPGEAESLVVTAHRDELLALRHAWSGRLMEESAQAQPSVGGE
ncbi:MAG TPA: cofactor assembly of complex C subunit B, partial [Leptolyngbyaceae cyanobacterium M65_K2018_010]|nr:cofactor assembly of complex C subunit B [Leptolyngbyaceae cyanobacterium M65_K2018_010]